MAQALLFTVQNVDGEIKIRDYLTKRLGFSTSIIAVVKYDNVTLNGKTVHMRATVKNGDVIGVTLPDQESENIPPIDIPLDIIYEDEHIIAVNKPINMPTHPSRGNHLPTLANAIMSYFNGSFVFRAISRLDRDTSGIVLIAKNQLSAAILSREMKKGSFRKIYEATVVGIPDPGSGEINAPIARETEGDIKRVVREDGKSAITRYRTIGITADNNAIMELEAITGRTHQLRVHMSYIGHPLVADFLYGERIENKTYRLHCKLLEFPHPISGETVTLHCPQK